MKVISGNGEQFFSLPEINNLIKTSYLICNKVIF